MNRCPYCGAALVAALTDSGTVCSQCNYAIASKVVSGRLVLHAKWDNSAAISPSVAHNSLRQILAIVVSVCASPTESTAIQLGTWCAMIRSAGSRVFIVIEEPFSQKWSDTGISRYLTIYPTVDSALDAIRKRVD